MSDTKVYQFGEQSQGGLLASILPMLSNRGVDSSFLAGLMSGHGGGGFFGGNGGFQDLIALVILFALFGNGNGNGIFGGGGNQNNAEREMLMSAMQRLGLDVSQLAQNLNCSVAQVNNAINQVASQICALTGQLGMTSQQIINSIQAGNASLASQICACCCDVKQLISESNYLTERGFCNTNQILTKGFSDLGYATRDQTCSIEKSIASSTQQILEGQRAAELRAMQDKMDALREKNAQQAVMLNNAQQTSQFAAMLAPIQADLAELKCNQVPVKKIACPETYIPVNRSVNENYALAPYCGFGGFSGFGAWGNNCNNFAWG
jgi:hypothetical protein